jgi:hypothetical protein
MKQYLEQELWRVRFQKRSLNYFNSPNPSSHTMALGLTHSLTEIMSTRKSSWDVKRDRRVRLTTF